MRNDEIQRALHGTYELHTRVLTETPEHRPEMAPILTGQVAIMKALSHLVDVTDDRKEQILAALDKEYPHLFTEEDKAGRQEAPIEDVVLRYMAQWGDIAGSDALANDRKERETELPTTH